MQTISLVLLPGMDGTGLLFAPLAARLPDWITPIVVSYPGDRQLSYEELLPFVIDRLPKTGPFVLLGESFSGPLAIMVADQRPAGLVGLILCATFVSKPWPLLGPVAVIFARAPLFYFYLSFKRLRAKLGGRLTPELRKLLAEMSTSVKPNVIAARVRAVFKIDVAETLRRCSIPMLYIGGVFDPVVPGWNLDRIQKIQPNIEVARMGKVHPVLQNHPAWAGDVVVGFVEGVLGGEVATR